MTEIVIGTTNPAKILQIQGALLPLKLNIYGMKKDENIPKVNEEGDTAQENAKKKALVYSAYLGKTVLSMDNALYFDGLPQDKQPGIFVRRINGIDAASDEELLNFYSKLITDLGKNKVTGYWEFAICLASVNGVLGETTIISPRIFTNVISSKTVKGYPLESIQIDPDSGKYISEMTQEEQDRFWQKMIGSKLCEFVQSVNL